MSSLGGPWKDRGFKTLVAWSSETDEGKEYRKRQALRRYEKRRSKLKEAGGPGMTAEDRQSILDHWGYRCAYCGAAQGEPRYYGSLKLQMDHVVPIPLGPDCPSNIVPACPACNSSKRDNDLKQWALARRIMLSSKVLCVYYRNKSNA